MAMKIIVAVMLVDDEDKAAGSKFYENAAVDIVNASNSEALRQIQTWVSEKVICAKLAYTKLDEG